MIKLIKAELKKIFHKKSFLVITVIFMFYSILTNVIYKEMNTLLNIDNLYTDELKEENKSLNLNNAEELDQYVTNITILETEELKKDYKDMAYIIDNKLYDLILEKNSKKFITKEDITDIDKQIEEYKNYIKKKDWRYFTNLELNDINESLSENKSERLKKAKSLEEYRLKNNVNYAEDNYLNKAIITIKTDLNEYYNLKEMSNLNSEMQKRYEALEEEMAINNYILEKKVDALSNNSLGAVLKNFSGEFGLFILIYVIMISGSIISEEFNKGTIKYLLTKPYKRSSILTAKLLTIMLLIPIILLFMVLIEIILGGIILGFNSLSVPVLIYHNGVIEAYHVLKYLGLLLLSSLPEYLVLSILCFLLSTVTTSTSAAITCTFLFYLIGNVISNLALIYNTRIFKYFISLHWNFDYLVNKTSNPYNFSWSFSLGIVIIYIVIMLCISYVYFNKKDVKNI